jgi:hypothetical protein
LTGYSFFYQSRAVLASHQKARSFITSKMEDSNVFQETASQSTEHVLLLSLQKPAVRMIYGSTKGSADRYDEGVGGPKDQNSEAEYATTRACQ